ncbi:MAG TPA: host specificity protein, partial [Paracoccus sp. (in: a-proteobacteria)]|nr:host specificity protein [Paracoccus sp. (in: a-proteobacteria)]
MATILLSAVGASMGAGFGGTFLGLTGAVIGRAVGATVGRVIDQRLLGGGSKPVETGRIDRLRLQTAGEGTPIARVWGQMRVPGHVIWASPVTEVTSTQGGGKGAGPTVTEVSYRLSLALALCEGPILGVGRVWADGEEVAAADLNMRVYLGGEAQLPDPCIAAHEGAAAPAYRGTAYVVLEELALERWGNRVPQLSFEVTRAAKGGAGLSRQVQAVAMIPGTGEYALATRQVSRDLGLGETQVINRNTPMGGTDFQVSLETLGRELPRVGSVSLVVSWFGDDLRAGHCTVRPKVEDKAGEGQEMPWRAGGIDRAEAREIARRDGRPIYGGTPADGAVVEALRAIAASGRKAVFYPFILMEQMTGNGLSDPWTGAADQPVMPWRGRITSSVAAGRAGSPDGTAAAEAEVAAAALAGHALDLG